MNYPSKRVMFSNGSYLRSGWQDIITENFISMVEHGYDTACWFPGELNSTSLALFEPSFCLAEEYGIKVMLAVPQWIYEADPTHPGYWSAHSGWNISNYETAFGDTADTLEADSRIVGYFTEVPDYVGSQWLRGKTDKIMMYDYYGAGVEATGWHFPEMIAMYDEVAFETFEICGNLTDCINSIATIHGIKPTIKMGEWCQTLPLWPTDVALYWAPLMSPLVPPPPPYDNIQRATGQYLTTYDGSPVLNQQDAAKYWIGLLQAQMLAHFGHKFDISIMQNFDNMGTFDAALTFHDSLSIEYSPGVPVKPVQQLEQKGHIPAYSGASVCTYPYTLVDSFANTGNEIIMLKSWSGTSTHTITVSGTLPNGLTTTQSYTRTLSPNQGTPIGPFPVDQFGSLATITYDNTNLYVAIIGAWRTGFEPL